MTKNIRAVFWDIDGTMVTSEALHNQKSWHIGRTYNLCLTDEIVASFQGVGDFRVYEIMQGLGFTGSIKDFLKICDDYYFDNIEHVEVREGFLEAFAYFDGLGVSQAAVSNATAPLVEVNIGRTGIGEKLLARVDLDYVTDKGLKPKPAADPYLEGLRIVNEMTGEAVRPDECLVIEDSATGVAAGKAAAMTTIFWKLSPEFVCAGSDYEAYTGGELMQILKRLFAVSE